MVPQIFEPSKEKRNCPSKASEIKKEHDHEKNDGLFSADRNAALCMCTDRKTDLGCKTAGTADRSDRGAGGTDRGDGGTDRGARIRTDDRTDVRTRAGAC